MGPRLFSLASLALLLLALCSTTSADLGWEDTYKIAEGPGDGDQNMRKELFSKIFVDSLKAKGKEKMAELDKVAGNTILAILLKVNGKYKTLPDFYQKALEHGMACERKDLNKNVKKILFDKEDGDTITENTGEKSLAENTLKPEFDIDVDPTCMGDNTKTLLKCISLGFGDTEIAKDSEECPAKAHAALLTKKLGQRMEASAKNENLPDIPDADMPEILCDAMNSTTVQPLVERVYAADALFWTLDAIPLKAHKFSAADLKILCEYEEFKAQPVPQCMCTFKVGASFCFAKALGQLYKEAGYLTCEGTPALVPEKKQAAEQKKPEAKAIKKPVITTTAATPSGGGSTVAPTSTPAASAATSILPLAPAATAAALLLLRH